jgi:hypothetical protein
MRGEETRAGGVRRDREQADPSDRRTAENLIPTSIRPHLRAGDGGRAGMAHVSGAFT